MGVCLSYFDNIEGLKPNNNRTTSNNNAASQQRTNNDIVDVCGSKKPEESNKNEKPIESSKLPPSSPSIINNIQDDNFNENLTNTNKKTKWQAITDLQLNKDKNLLKVTYPIHCFYIIYNFYYYVV